jgi:hypothetical protein
MYDRYSTDNNAEMKPNKSRSRQRGCATLDHTDHALPTLARSGRRKIRADIINALVFGL